MAPPEPSATQVIEGRQELSRYLADKQNEGRAVLTHLTASNRVIARVTDGIYRQPASALRELIANAWDADANKVSILTDAPRFSRIYVRDDGAGMTYEVLSRLLKSIGGSAKRQHEGEELGVTSQDDPERSKGGRLLIGKIGIGLFSVSQLSRRFRIITKVKDTDYRLIAEVKLRAYSEEHEGDEDSDSSIAGEVMIVREPAEDISAHGTDVILEDIKPRVRDLLRSDDRWRAVRERNAALEASDFETAANIRVEEPKYHSGWISDLRSGSESPSLLTIAPKLPWDVSDPEGVRMAKLMEAVEAEFSWTDRPDLATSLDAYLEMLWTLALSAPLEYVDRHPFDMTSEDNIQLFWISNDARGKGTEIPMHTGERVRDAVQKRAPGNPVLEDGRSSAVGGFQVIVDGIELKRPIKFKFLPYGKSSIDKAMLFVGRYAPDLSKVKKSVRGGPLALDGYLFWNSRIIPKENNGALVRIRGASGATFDSTFFKYQISEQTRLRQITSELFIWQGLDAALNIDRESFNFSHPHVQLVSIWFHNAIRQLTNRHKDISQRLRSHKQAREAEASRDALVTFADQVWQKRRGFEDAPDVVVEPNPARLQFARKEGYLAVARPPLESLRAAPEGERKEWDARTAALVKVLAAYGVLEDRPYEEQQSLIDAILTIFTGPPIR